MGGVRYAVLAAVLLLAAPALAATWIEIEGTANADHIRGTAATDRIRGLGHSKAVPRHIQVGPLPFDSVPRRTGATAEPTGVPSKA